MNAEGLADIAANVDPATAAKPIPTPDLRMPILKEIAEYIRSAGTKDPMAIDAGTLAA